MQTQAPWTDVGRLQSEVDSLKQKLTGKVDSHAIDSLRNKVDHLEHSLREIRANVNELLDRVQWQEN